MADKPNFVLIPEEAPPTGGSVTLLGRLMALVTGLLPGGTTALAPWDGRPRLVFGFDATASREPAWATARTVTDSLVRALPGELDVALAVHGGGLLHTFTEFTSNPNKVFLPHPIYDQFGEKVGREAAIKELGLSVESRYILFFGFIRKYKGLDLLLEALEILRKENAKPWISDLRLLVAGEFYDDKKPYLAQIAKAGIEDALLLRTNFIPDSEVRYFLCAADLVVQPYRNASQSGVTPLAYYFEKPMIVTNVGGLPSLVPHEKTGLVAEPDPVSLAQAILRFYELGEDYFIHHLRSEKKKYSWNTLVNSISNICHDLQK